MKGFRLRIKQAIATILAAVLVSTTLPVIPTAHAASADLNSTYIARLKASNFVFNRASYSSKKAAMICVAEKLMEEGFEPAFAAGVMANVACEGAFGRFENITGYTATRLKQVYPNLGSTHNYIAHMNGFSAYDSCGHNHSEYKTYNNKCIYNGFSVSAVSSMLTKYQNEGWKARFGIGSIQWTATRAATLVNQFYKPAAGANGTLTLEQCTEAEMKMIVHELTNGYNYVYTGWKNANSSLSTESAAQNAGYRVCYYYEVPASRSTVATTRGNLAKEIFNTMRTALETYSVTFDANGGSGAPSTQKAECGVPFSLSAAVPRRDGYIFEGWSLQSTGSTVSYQPGNPITLSGNLTLYAVWSKIPAPADPPEEKPEPVTAINATNFPDAAFRSKVSGYDKNGDGSLSSAELSAVTSMDVSGKNVKSLKGIEHFTALTELRCTNNSLTALDLSKLTKLQHLDCSGNRFVLANAAENGTISLAELTANGFKPAKAKNFKNGTKALTFDSSANTLSGLTAAEDGYYTVTYDYSTGNSDFPTANFSLKIITHNHTPVKISAVAATCTTSGKTEGSKCSVCGEIIKAQTNISAKGHTWDDGVITTEPTTTTKGVMTYTCTACKETRTESVPVVSMFADVPSTAWYASYVNKAVELELMSGMGSDNFNPTGNTSRAMFVQVLYAMEGAPDVTFDHPFTDISSTRWYSKAIQWAYTNQITGGLTATTFGPDANVTREQIALFLYSYADKPAVTGDLSSFQDGDTVSSWAKDAMLWATQSGIISGSGSDGTRSLNPKNLATRGECATMVVGFYDRMSE